MLGVPTESETGILLRLGNSGEKLKMLVRAFIK